MIRYIWHKLRQPRPRLTNSRCGFGCPCGSRS